MAEAIAAVQTSILKKCVLNILFIKVQELLRLD
jgi:hypothetical protein